MTSLAAPSSNGHTRLRPDSRSAGAPEIMRRPCSNYTHRGLSLQFQKPPSEAGV